MAKNKAAVALGRRGGKATGGRKAEAVRANGAKGGRPGVLYPVDPRQPVYVVRIYPHDHDPAVAPHYYGTPAGSWCARDVWAWAAAGVPLDVRLDVRYDMWRDGTYEGVRFADDVWSETEAGHIITVRPFPRGGSTALRRRTFRDVVNATLENVSPAINPSVRAALAAAVGDGIDYADWDANGSVYIAHGVIDWMWVDISHADLS